MYTHTNTAIISRINCGSVCRGSIWSSLMQHVPSSNTQESRDMVGFIAECESHETECKEMKLKNELATNKKKYLVLDFEP